MPKIHLETVIFAPRPLVFDLARDVNVHAQTVSFTKERPIGTFTDGKLALGDVVTFEALHFGVTQQLTARLTKFVYPELFADEMVSGAFQYLTHSHRFCESTSGATVMIDDLEFLSPLGFLGKIADALFLERYMTSFLMRRNENLKIIAEGSVAKIRGEQND